MAVEYAEENLELSLHHQRRELAAITAMVETVASTLDLDQVVSRALHLVMEVLELACGAIYLRDTKGELREAALKDPSGNANGWIEAFHPLAASVISSGAAAQQRLQPQGDEVGGFLAIAPLYSKGALLGVIAVAAPVARTLDEPELHLLSRLARHAGMAISNASLYRDLQQAYQELQAAQAQLVEAERHKIAIQMAGAAAHELNQPLTVIVGYSSILARSIKPGDTSYPIVEKIERNAQKMNEIVKRLGQLTQYKTREYMQGEEIVDIRQDDDDL